MERFALISVYDKTGVIEFARFLNSQGIKILSTGGTAQHLESNGLKVISISDYTGYPEILEGRVKSLHPKVHGGILARRDRSADDNDLSNIKAHYIDYVVMNLYPFTKEAAKIEKERNANHGSLVELIDVGGPAMLRAAAKNFAHVVPICDPDDYLGVKKELEEHSSLSLESRRNLAAKAFATTSQYDGEIARYFALNEKLLQDNGNAQLLAPVESVVLEKRFDLRYGENPHQRSAVYRRLSIVRQEGEIWSQLQGKELSYNNLVDTEAAVNLFLDLQRAFPKKCASVIIKHTNPCGSAIRDSALEAFVAARACDPLSAFGGIVVCGGTLEGELAQSIIENFVEVVISSDVAPSAREVFSQKKNVRLIECDFTALKEQQKRIPLQFRPFWGDFLLQTTDDAAAPSEKWKVVSEEGKFGNCAEMLRLAWVVCKHTKSNAIVLAKDFQAIGVGAGQMSRVDSARLAVDRAKHHGFEVNGSVAASDAFLPFPDTLETLADAGVQALVQPGGAMRDEEVIVAAKRRGIVMALTGERHFRH